MQRLSWLLGLLSLLLIAACASATPPPATNHNTTVVATFSILGEFVAQVGGDHISVVTLVGPGSDAHTFEPSPGDNVTLNNATLIFEIGAGFEPWLDDLYAASGSQARRLVVSNNIDMHTASEGSHEEEGNAANEHGEFDPHIWQNVQNAIKMVDAIAAALSEVAPTQADTFRANAAAYIAKLQELDRWIEEQVAILPVGQRKLVTAHDTLGYFAERYGFEVIGSAVASASTEVADPAAAELAALIDQVKAAGVSAIFTENVSNPELAERITEEAIITLAPPLYSDALGESGSAGDTYLKMMRYNVETIVEALK